MKGSPTLKDQEFEDICGGIRSLFAEYQAEDVFISLCISDLWLPNISSQVKHTLAWMVACSMPVSAFNGTSEIESYSDFKLFIEKLYAALPQFPTLEDYVPETDWGEIRYLSKGVPLRIFYGNVVERISDFITAFQLVHKDEDQANKDIHFALLVQNYILTHVDKGIAGSTDDIEIGHLEPPSEEFWRKCRRTILDLSSLQDFSRLSAGLVLKIGRVSLPPQMSDFADAIMQGTALPGFLIEFGGRLYPLALRNAVAAVIQYWADQNSGNSINTIADFIYARFRHVIKGPLQIVTRKEQQPYVYTCAILDGPKPYLIIALEESKLVNLPQIEANLKRALSTGDWDFKRVGRPETIQIRGEKGLPPRFEDIVILAVLSSVTTVTSFCQLPKTKIRFLPLPDFVTIFDSIESIDELDRYWAFTDTNVGVVSSFCGPADCFAAFQDTHALLADGAEVPTMIMLDPHWGSIWRYRILAKYWDNSPPLFPEVLQTAWKVERDSNGIFTLTGKRFPAFSQSVVIGACVIHFVMIIGHQALEVDDGRTLQMLLMCIADALNQRNAIVAGLPIFTKRQIVTICHANMATLVSRNDQDHSSEPLFSSWKLNGSAQTGSVFIEVQANLQHVLAQLTDARDASFEVAAALSWIEQLSAAIGFSLESEVVDALRSTSSLKPRFTMKSIPRFVDVPDYSTPQVPSPEHYKIARRDLAIIFKAIGGQEGTYELEDAKVLIDKARDRFRALVHERITALRQSELILFCIQQLDKLTSKYDRKQIKLEMSLAHEVDYDRANTLAEAQDQFIKDSKNYRYLLECRLSLPAKGIDPVSEESVVQLIASIDWLLVLYNASDVLHHGIDVAGLKLDQFFIPSVFYTELTGDNESAFALESADFRLGIGLQKGDKVHEIDGDDQKWENLDQGFEQDTGVRLSKFLASLKVLSCWPSTVGSLDLAFSYSAPRNKICDVLVESIDEMTSGDAERVLGLLTLDSRGIKRLLGKTTDEGDVPLWEHNKRGDRYTIKPLVLGEDDNLVWGAAMTERSERIWRQSLINGYMPADYDWPNVKSRVREIKADLEKRLETTAAAVFARATVYVKEGIDFKRRFPTEGFDDAGDFDGLAYWPDMNLWVTAECKYNQPAFCLKDARRLRDRIFGSSGNRGQFSKIERRRIFIQSNLEKIRQLLGWPEPKMGISPKVKELYVSRDIYWWMRNTPYEVPTEFVRVDSLESWLRDNELLD